MPNDELRMYVVIRKDVGEVITKGKFGVQCSHAILSAWIDCLKRDPDRAWAYHTASQPKIAMEVKDEKALRTTYGKARESGFHTALITDAGRTEFEHPTVTAIAIGPVWYEREAQAGFIKRLQVYRENKTNLTIRPEHAPYLTYILHDYKDTWADYSVPARIDRQVTATIAELLPQLPPLDDTLGNQ